MPDFDLIRRMLDAGDPIPPRIVRQLIEEIEQAKASAASFQRLATQYYAGRLIAQTDYRVLSDAALAWSDAIDRCDGIVAAEERLRETLKELS